MAATWHSPSSSAHTIARCWLSHGARLRPRTIYKHIFCCSILGLAESWHSPSFEHLFMLGIFLVAIFCCAIVGLAESWHSPSSFEHSSLRMSFLCDCSVG